MGCVWCKDDSPLLDYNPLEYPTETNAHPDSSGFKNPRVGFITNNPFDIPHCNENAQSENQDEHDGLKHPECHDRVELLWSALEKHQLLSRGFILSPRRAKEEELDLIHTRQHQQNIKSEKVNKNWEKSVYLAPGSFDAALTAAGSVLELTQEVWRRKLDRGFAVVRPPGHHAEVSRAQGFCLFNNVALAAAWLTTKGGMSRVAIVDWDVHAGNGQQEIFYDDPKVLTISIHRYDNANYYPFSTDGGPIRVGGPNARGKNINIGWNVTRERAPGNGEYKYAFEKVVLPNLRDFSPEFILVAAGFDAAEGDPLGGLKVTQEGYEWMTRMLCSLNVPVVLTLEGGYNLENLQTCGCACARALLNLETHLNFNFDFPHFQYITDVAITTEALKRFDIF
jgi:acetoin utilization deacetylase AcuC-like enzyme